QEEDGYADHFDAVFNHQQTMKGHRVITSSWPGIANDANAFCHSQISKEIPANGYLEKLEFSFKTEA
ncbi:MAG: hypothetical protein KKA76_06545, partial [Proteobacteria bacterium]|nr:hypothetical protein [Pseudomonadota bacterium]